MVGKRVLGLVLMVAATAGCTATDGSRGATASTDTHSAGVADCGSFDLDRGQGLPESAVRCLVDAVAAKRPVRLAETRPTTEGDPVTITYRTDTQGRVEVITDFRRDHFSSRRVSRETCTGPAPIAGRMTFAHCSEPTPIAN